MLTDPRIDAYIEAAQPFARPILEHLREVVHCALPQAEETIKWSMPHFTLNGKNVAGMAAFKAHAAFVIHGDGRLHGEGLRGPVDTGAMGQFGKLATLADLPSDASLSRTLSKAADRITNGVKTAPVQSVPKPEIPVPDDFAMALAIASPAKRCFEAFSPSHRREYLEWIVDAKKVETRQKRINQAIVWLSEGKKRNWKYEAC